MEVFARPPLVPRPVGRIGNPCGGFDFQPGHPRRTPIRYLAAILLLLPFTAGASLAQSGAAAGLNSEALRLVNADRQENGLPALAAGSQLAAAAPAHAEDMLARDYYAHVSPSGEDVQDRYGAAGGSQWEIVAENIARCQGCAASEATLAELQQGWMESPGHRRNILAEGLERFGFGLAAGDGTLYAVQTFAGPGMPRGLDAGETLAPVDAEAAAAVILDSINRARQEAGLQPLALSQPLSAAAETLLPAADAAEFSVAGEGDLYGALPEAEQAAWRRLALASGACGGCGREPTEADVEAFAEDWLANAGIRGSLLGDSFTHLGFGIAANGEGKKLAVAVTGETR
jgi:uncharacterized protein YkwD